MEKDFRGKLIVFEGGDGSGKTTQAKMLVDYLTKNNLRVKYMDFPRYYNSFHGKTVARFLRGEFGKINEVSPYLVSLAYALDRESAKDEMINFLKDGGYIVANRYATSSMAHQSAKLKDKKKRDEFLQWLNELEYKVNKIPKENIVIYLYVPWKISLGLTNTKKNRRYLNGKKLDIQEENIEYRKVVEKIYLDFSTRYDWIKINCISNGKLLSRETIHKKIIASLKEKKLI